MSAVIRCARCARRFTGADGWHCDLRTLAATCPTCQAVHA